MAHPKDIAKALGENKEKGEPPGGAGFWKGKAFFKGENQEKGEPPGVAGFDAEVSHPKDIGKAKGENQETGKPPGGAGFQTNKAKVEGEN